MQCHAEQEGNRHPQPKPALPNKSQVCIYLLLHVLDTLQLQSTPCVQDLAGEKKVVGKELQGKWQKNIAQVGLCMRLRS